MSERIEEFNNVLNDINAEILNSHSDNLIDDGIIDSLSLVQLTIALEETFSIIIDPDEIVEDNFRTIENIWELVKKCLQEKEHMQD